MEFPFTCIYDKYGPKEKLSKWKMKMSEIKDDLLKNGKEIKDEPMEEDEENGI